MSDSPTPDASASDMRKGRTPKLASSVHDVNAEKPPFGSRFLTADADVFSQNAWDHVPPPDEHDEHIAASLARQRAAPCPEPERQKINDRPAKHWCVSLVELIVPGDADTSGGRDNFYKTNADNFFRDRNWLSLEFPELLAATAPDAGPQTVCEIGCGAGNTAFPLLTTSRNPSLTIHALDFAAHAIKLVQRHPLYTAPPPGAGRVRAAVWDLTAREMPAGVREGSVDVALMVFVMSALGPGEWESAVRSVWRLLKPGGLLLLRDYGRYDLAQLRFRTGRLLGDNFYARGDKTRVYFFELDELALLFTGERATPAQKASAEGVRVEDEEEGQEGAIVNGGTASPGIAGAHTPVPQSDGASSPDASSAGLTAGFSVPTPSLDPSSLPPSQAGATPAPESESDSDPSRFASAERAAASLHASGALFTAEQLGVDRRLLVNRKRQLKMYRVWVQGKFRKV
ncbi:methyltransferase [Coniophora puteana RWD-64-598 SS2]|uniref:Methyltransferase n=1 Tax=Coniophora puteana (strain RWD-64-598) TaxID=741705 RepID=A0A5M3M877_CONPW|nr:methyltransferase [Coniophora puteana RWD-64-598 SS2]EIW75247.1 methyltransferase [Coniophora puteana RWD-64-598 SS2]